MSDLRDHVATAHHQGDAAYEGDDDTIGWWHTWEHEPRGYGTHLGHAHDEMSARRHGVALTAVGREETG